MRADIEGSGLHWCYDLVLKVDRGIIMFFSSVFEGEGGGLWRKILKKIIAKVQI